MDGVTARGQVTVYLWYLTSHLGRISLLPSTGGGIGPSAPHPSPGYAYALMWVVWYGDGVDVVYSG